MLASVPLSRTSRTTIGKRRVAAGAMGKLTLVVSSVLLLAIITVTFSVVDPLLFVTSNLP